MLSVGCRHAPPKNTTPVTDTQAPVLKTLARPPVDPAEKRLQQQIEEMQDQIASLTTRSESMARFHGAQMSPKWIERVQAARAEASRESERMRYLEATKALLVRKLQALRSELKIYEEFEASDPALPRP